MSRMGARIGRSLLGIREPAGRLTVRDGVIEIEVHSADRNDVTRSEVPGVELDDFQEAVRLLMTWMGLPQRGTPVLMEVLDGHREYINSAMLEPGWSMDRLRNTSMQRLATQELVKQFVLISIIAVDADRELAELLGAPVADRLEELGRYAEARRIRRKCRASSPPSRPSESSEPQNPYHAAGELFGRVDELMGSGELSMRKTGPGFQYDWRVAFQGWSNVASRYVDDRDFFDAPSLAMLAESVSQHLRKQLKRSWADHELHLPT